MKSIIFALLCLSSERVFACSTNYDCDPGSKCIKEESYSTFGVCTKSPYSSGGAPTDRGEKPYGHEKAGNSCYSKYDCGVGGECIKVGNALEGVCTR